jgi:hypothetical protein
LISIFLFSAKAFELSRSLEKIVYVISPLGRAQFDDWGEVKFNNKISKLFTFRTQVMGFDDREKIYTDNQTYLPLRVERDISIWLGKEYIIEDYNPQNFSLVITKFEGKKIVKEYCFKENGPIHNAVILPFYLRKIPELNIGWSMEIRLPNKFEVKLVSIDEIQVPAGKFKAYHFISEPKRFEIWLSADKLRLPLKIIDLSGLGYTLSMQEYVIAE